MEIPFKKLNILKTERQVCHDLRAWVDVFNYYANVHDWHSLLLRWIFHCNILF